MRGAVVALLVFTLSASAPAAAQDAFEQRREAERAAMTGPRPLLLTPGDGRLTFHLGEVIPLTLEFEPRGEGPLTLTPCRGMALQVVVDDQEGVSAPWRTSFNSGLEPGCGRTTAIYGGEMAMAWGPLGLIELETLVPPLDVMLKREDVYLTDALRFDTPGRYRVYLRSFNTASENGTPPRLSNPLTLEILAPDEAWQAATVRRARQSLEAPSSPDDKAAAVRTLVALGTPEAFDALIAQPDFDSEVAYWMRDRGHTRARMEARLDEVGLPVTHRDAAILTALELADAVPAPPVRHPRYLTRLRAHSARRLRALDAAGALDTALAEDMRDAARGLGDWRPTWRTMPAGFPDVAAAIERALDTLTPAEQRRVLEERKGWQDLTDVAFLPMFRRLAASPAADGPQDVALALWFRHDAAGARRFALAAMTSGRMRFSAAGVAAMPDGPRPDLDAPLARALEDATSGARLAQVMSLVARFGTARIEARVRRAFEHAPFGPDCPQEADALSFFFRVAPAYATGAFDRVWRGGGSGRECRQGLLMSIADRGVPVGLELAATTWLRSADVTLASDAAQVLARHGPKRSETALWSAFQAWHDYWAPRKAKLERDSSIPRWGAGVERAFVEALGGATHWRPARDFDARLARLCVSTWCSSGAWKELLDRSPTNIEPTDSAMPGGPPTVFAGTRLLVGLAQLRAYSRLWPRGTTWRWRQRWESLLAGPARYVTTAEMSADQEAVFASVRRSLEASGMRLTRE